MSDAIHAITMPRWGMTITEGKVVDWLVGEGDAVTPADDMVEIETTKITNVMEAPAAGILRRRVVGVGTTAPVGALIGIVADAGVADADIDAFIAGFKVVTPDVELDTEDDGDTRIVAVGAHRINVHSTGSGGGLPVVMVHGFGGDLYTWLFNQPTLSDDFTVHALDMPGHGASDLDVGSGSVGDLAVAVTETIDILDVESAHLVGHSLGGAVCLSMALDAPERVASATLLCPSGLGPEINWDFIERFISADRRRAMKEALGMLFSDPGVVNRQMVELALMYMRMDGVHDVLRKIADRNFPNGVQTDIRRGDLDGLGVPLQVVWGRDDRIIPAAQADGLPAAVGVHLLEAAGHLAHMEQPREINRLIGDFAAANA